ncbi:MAG: hypothetical protein HYZ29_04040 [Myxococcales bacterium]|nr:hypothetical protein [Myxococcales bacterium]
MTDDRRLILERRERFLRATLYGAAAGVLVAACDQTGPVCHSVRRNLPRVVANGVGCAALPCLSIEPLPPPSDAGTD